MSSSVRFAAALLELSFELENMVSFQSIEQRMAFRSKIGDWAKAYFKTHGASSTCGTRAIAQEGIKYRKYAERTLFLKIADAIFEDNIPMIDTKWAKSDEFQDTLSLEFTTCLLYPSTPFTGRAQREAYAAPSEKIEINKKV